jgi:hypothetical protein
MMISPSELQSLHDVFEYFAREEFRDYSPLYREIAEGIAEDESLLGMCVERLPGQPAPNLIFAAVQYLLLDGVKHELRNYYPSCVEVPLPPQGAFPYFRDFCVMHEEELRELISTRLVQTNEVGRSACLLPVYAMVSKIEQGAELAMVDFGCSGGLNMLFDRFRFDYGRLRWGDAGSPVQLKTSLRNEAKLPLETASPTVGYRIGVDLNPIDVTDPDELLWLRALVWPEHKARYTALVAAAGLMADSPPQILQGDGVAMLPGILGAVPEGLPIVVYTSFVLHQLTHEERESFFSTLREVASQRPLYFVSMGGSTLLSQVELTTWREGEMHRRTLLECAAHGQWLRWLAS